MEQARRTRRLQMFGGVALLAVLIVAAVIVVTSTGGSSHGNPIRASKVVSAKAACSAAKATAVCNRVDSLLAGIPQSGNTLGNPKAKITVTEFGDLECSVCDAFADAANVDTSAGTPGTGYEDQLINQYVRTGKVKLVYRSLETATGHGATPGIWTEQQTAPYAAGLQDKAWYYIELFYNLQQPEGTPYTRTFLEGIARLVPGLNYSAWLTNLQNPKLQAKVSADNSAGTAVDSSNPNGVGTPTIVVTGPKGQAQPIDGLPGAFSELSSEINSVS